MRILGFALLAVAACYSPSSETCEFTCTADNPVCPSGLACVAGVCQSGSQAMCGQTGDGGFSIDAPVSTGDGGGSSLCPAPPPTCALVSGNGSDCVAFCESSKQSWANAKLQCAVGSAWELAVFDKFTPTVAEIPFGTETWIGLSRATASGALPWTWLGTAETVSPMGSDWSSDVQHNGTVGTVAAIDGGKLFSEATGDVARAFACTIAPNVATGD